VTLAVVAPAAASGPRGILEIGVIAVIGFVAGIGEEIVMGLYVRKSVKARGGSFPTMRSFVFVPRLPMMMILMVVPFFAFSSPSTRASYRCASRRAPSSLLPSPSSRRVPAARGRLMMSGCLRLPIGGRRGGDYGPASRGLGRRSGLWNRVG
jgi:hypothetical protein